MHPDTLPDMGPEWPAIGAALSGAAAARGSKQTSKAMRWADEPGSASDSQRNTITGDRTISNNDARTVSAASRVSSMEIPVLAAPPGQKPISAFATADGMLHKPTVGAGGPDDVVALHTYSNSAVGMSSPFMDIASAAGGIGRFGGRDGKSSPSFTAGVGLARPLSRTGSGAGLTSPRNPARVVPLVADTSDTVGLLSRTGSLTAAVAGGNGPMGLGTPGGTSPPGISPTGSLRLSMPPTSPNGPRPVQPTRPGSGREVTGLAAAVAAAVMSPGRTGSARGSGRFAANLMSSNPMEQVIEEADEEAFAREAAKATGKAVIGAHAPSTAPAPAAALLLPASGTAVQESTPDSGMGGSAMPLASLADMQSAASTDGMSRLTLPPPAVPMLGMPRAESNSTHGSSVVGPPGSETADFGNAESRTISTSSGGGAGNGGFSDVTGRDAMSPPAAGVMERQQDGGNSKVAGGGTGLAPPAHLDSKALEDIMLAAGECRRDSRRGVYMYVSVSERALCMQMLYLCLLNANSGGSINLHINHTRHLHNVRAGST